MSRYQYGNFGSNYTHCYRLLVVLLAANQVRDIDRDLGSKGTAVGLDPLFHLFMRAVLAEISSYCNHETLKRVLHVDGRVLDREEEKYRILQNVETTK